MNWAWCGSLVAKVLTLDALGSNMGTDYKSQRLQFPSSSLPVVWEGSQGRPKALGPCFHVGDLEEAPVSCLQISTAPATVAT